jgi:T-complex protein 1 subunit gamma
MIKIIKSCIGTKFVSKWSDLACKIALDAVSTVAMDENGRKEIDIKRYARIEKVRIYFLGVNEFKIHDLANLNAITKIPGGSMEDSEVLKGVMINKDIVHPRMRRQTENPRILLLDCNLEYKKGESQTSLEFSKEADFA